MILSWKPGAITAPVNGHKVYFSSNFEDVSNGIDDITQSQSTFNPGLLDFGTTYYWRVDEVNPAPDYMLFEGDVWSFTTEFYSYPIAGENIIATASSVYQEDIGPENTINGSGPDANGFHSTDETAMWLSVSEPQGAWIEYEFDKVYKLHEMWVWNINQLVELSVGLGMKDVTIEYSTNGTDYTTLGTMHEFAQAPGADGYAHNTTVDFGGASAKYVRLTSSNAWGAIVPRYGLNEVRFFYIPVNATEPYPANGATGVDIEAALGWRAGRETVTHDVYLGKDEQSVMDGMAPTAPVTDASYNPSSLELDTEYYWKVGEVNEAQNPTTWESNIWSFTTSDHIVIDDFESYNDLNPDDPESNRIFLKWIGGDDQPANGSQVGHDTFPFAETAIVHGGNQSMPFYYNNSGNVTYSEGEYVFTAGQDWTNHGANTLLVWFYGTEGNTGQLYVKISGVEIPYDSDAGNLGIESWQSWNIDLTASELNLQNVSSLSIGVKGSNTGGLLYFDDFQLVASPPPPFNDWAITDDADDVEEVIGTGEMDITSSDLELAYEHEAQDDPQIIGLRFTGITIPKGATITEAWVRFSVDEDKGGTEPVNLIIEGELNTNAAGFTSDLFNVSSRPATMAQVKWSVPNWINIGEQGPDQTTPSIIPIIQEIVNQDGWAGGVIVLIFRDDPTNPSLGIRCAGAGPGGRCSHIAYKLSIE